MVISKNTLLFLRHQFLFSDSSLRLLILSLTMIIKLECPGLFSSLSIILLFNSLLYICLIISTLKLLCPMHLVAPQNFQGFPNKTLNI